MLDQRDYTGRAALHHAVAEMDERHLVVKHLLASKAQVSAYFGHKEYADRLWHHASPRRVPKLIRHTLRREYACHHR